MRRRRGAALLRHQMLRGTEKLWDDSVRLHTVIGMNNETRSSLSLNEILSKANSGVRGRAGFGRGGKKEEEGVAIFISRGFNVLLTSIGEERERGREE